MQHNQDLRFRRRAMPTPGEERPKSKFGLILAAATAAVILPALVYSLMHPATVSSTVKQIARHVTMKSFRVAVVASRETPTPAPSLSPQPTPAATASGAPKARREAEAAHEAHLKHLRALAHAAHQRKLALTEQTSDVAGPSTPVTQFVRRQAPSTANAAAGPAGGSAVTPTPAAVALAPTQQPQADATPLYAPDVVVDARFTHQVQPDYPEIAKMQNAQGSAVVLATIGPDGKVIDARIERSTGNKLLDSSALAAARESGFQPPLIDGKPATETYRLVYSFVP